LKFSWKRVFSHLCITKNHLRLGSFV
jgi:hypothetical protein